MRAEPAATIGVPDVDPALVNEAWRLALAEGGGTVVVLLLATGAFLKWGARMLERLINEQGKSLAVVAEAVGKVEGAVNRLDTHIAARLDRVEGRVEHVERDHGHRLTVLEAEAAVSGARRRPRAAAQGD